ncbi:rod-determining factor RdfA [Halosolutus halophilus]|uniref:rod-determining factor RdfA n=1 Tax=Halosolutus halophilus TaxID=1552990 RepID=UPI0022352892|nr:rod-determining factor RdfA [Halosolutus halophilus]
MGTLEDKTEHRTKVSRLIDKYDLGNLGEELEHMWTAEGNERRSLRQLSTLFNKRLLRSAIEDSEFETVSGELDSIYQQIQGEKGSPADQTRTRRQLERDGVVVESVESDFVTYQAIRSYLKKERNAEYEPADDPIERDKTSIQQLRNRTAAVTETKLEGLDKADQIELGPHQVTVDINVFCENCGRQFDVTEILDQKGCGCAE